MIIALVSLVQAAAGAPAACELSPEQSPIVFNQTGFEAGAGKWAIVRSAADEALPWRIVDSSEDAAAEGVTRPFGYDPASGDRVHQIDFSDFDSVGDGYRIEACGVRSRRFDIESAPYGALAEDALRYFYLNRLGAPIEADYAGGEAWARNAGFTDSRLTCFSGRDREGVEWPGCAHRLDTTGGWADAGDYGQYVVNGGISVWTLQHAYERLDADGALDALGWRGDRVPLPGREPGRSEILVEARWHLEFMLAMQIPEDAQVWVDARGPGASAPDLQRLDGGGLVHHKLHERAWLPLPILPEDADQPRFLYPPSTAATLNLAAAAAQAARLWADLDPSFSSRALTAARSAFQAARRHPELYARNNFDGGGPYGDDRLDDEFYWAAAELYLTTGGPEYLDVLQAVEPTTSPPNPIFWSDTELLAELSLALTGRDPAIRARAQNRLLATAQAYLRDADAEGYRYPMPADQMTWGSNANLLNRGLVLAAAYDITEDREYRDGALHALDYVLGRNALDLSYVAGHGDRAMTTPHHRFWAYGADPEFPPAPPGALSGGANHINMADPVARSMSGECAPQRCWVDHVDAYALNEVAINWNAPLFALVVFLESTSPLNQR